MCGRDPYRKSYGNEPALEMESIVLYAEVLIQLQLPTPSPLPERSARYHNTDSTNEGEIRDTVHDTIW